MKTRTKKKPKPTSTRLNKTALLLFALLAASCGSSGDDAAETVTISIIGTNDVHGTLLADGYVGGFDVFAGYLNNLREARSADGGGVVLLDGGDMWQGTLESNLSEGRSTVSIFNAVGYDAAAIGNHEFDFGPLGPNATPTSPGDDPQGALKAHAALANFPLLSSNIIDTETGTHIDWENVYPSVQKTVAGIEVGIIGGTTESTPRTTIVANIDGLEFSSLALAFREQAEKLRATGADIVVITVHAGGRCEEHDDPYDLASCRENSEVFRAARSLPEGLVDVIVGGHAHEGISHFVNGIAIISSYSNMRAFGRVDLTIDQASRQVVDRKIFPPRPLCAVQAKTMDECANAPETAMPARYEGKEVVADKRIQAVVAEAIADVDAARNRRLGVIVADDFNRGRYPNTPIANLLSDIMLASSEIGDFALHNAVGGIRANLPAGDLTYGAVYQVFPFDNRVVHLELTGAEVRAVYERQMSVPRWTASASGIRVTAECRDGKPHVTLQRPDGSSIADEEVLTVVTTDFLALGGDGIFSPVFPEEGFDYEDESPLFRDKMVQWLERRGGELRSADFADAESLRFDLEQQPPFDCTSPD